MLSADRPGLTSDCLVCGRLFTLVRLTQRTCSHACRVARVCAVCGSVGSRIGRDGLCGPCRPEIAFLNALYAIVAGSGRTLLDACPVGHPYDVANTLVLLRRTPSPWIARHCRLCIAANKRRGRQQTKLRLVRTLHRDIGAALGQVAA